MKYYVYILFSKTIMIHLCIIYDDKDKTFFAIIITFCNFFIAKCELFSIFYPFIKIFVNFITTNIAKSKQIETYGLL